MTWREKMVCRILLLIAIMMSEDSQLSDQLRYLSNSISQHRDLEVVE